MKEIKKYQEVQRGVRRQGRHADVEGVSRAETGEEEQVRRVHELQGEAEGRVGGAKGAQVGSEGRSGHGGHLDAERGPRGGSRRVPGQGGGDGGRIRSCTRYD